MSVPTSVVLGGVGTRVKLRTDRSTEFSDPCGCEIMREDECPVGGALTPLTYDGSHPHLVTAFGGVYYGYDQNGNMLTRTVPVSTAFAYDSGNRLVKVTQGLTVCRYAYDGNGARVKRLDAQGTIHYVGAYERNLGIGAPATNIVTKHYMAILGSQSILVATRRAGTLTYIGVDHLGGTLRAADTSGNPIANGRVRYGVWGAARDSAPGIPTDRHFTGQTEDAVSGLYWYASRYYDANLGRFIQPDTIVPDMKNPQYLNRYAYCLNNPLKYSDPTGHDVRWNDRVDAHGGATSTPIAAPTPAASPDSLTPQQATPTPTPVSGWGTSSLAFLAPDAGDAITIPLDIAALMKDSAGAGSRMVTMLGIVPGAAFTLFSVYNTEYQATNNPYRAWAVASGAAVGSVGLSLGMVALVTPAAPPVIIGAVIVGGFLGGKIGAEAIRQQWNPINDSVQGPKFRDEYRPGDLNQQPEWTLPQSSRTLLE